MPRHHWQTGYRHRRILRMQSGENGAPDPATVRKHLLALLDAPDVEERGLPGCVITQYQRCQHPRCRCQRGELHGPYYYWNGRMLGVTWKKYLRREDAPRVRALCQRRRDRRWTRARSRALVRAHKRQLAALTELVGW